MTEEQKPKSKLEQAQAYKEQGLSGVEIAKLLNLTPGRISQMVGKRRIKQEPKSE